jgi:hypothetical protein
MRRQPKSSSPKNNKLERYVLAWLAFDDDMLCTGATRREKRGMMAFYWALGRLFPTTLLDRLLYQMHK